MDPILKGYEREEGRGGEGGGEESGGVFCFPTARYRERRERQRDIERERERDKWRDIENESGGDRESKAR